MAGYDEAMREYERQREEADGKSVDDLIALTNGKNECEFLFAIEMALQQKEERVGDANLSPEERIVLAIESLEREVNNGGYNLFFINSSRQYAAIIVESLTRIGCPEVAALTRKAIEVIHPAAWTPESIGSAVASYAEEEQRRWKMKGKLFDRMPANVEYSHDAMREELNECDEMFYQTDENIGLRLIDFIKANKVSIRP